MSASASRRILAAVLFTDIVNSTQVAEELGDRRWKALVHAHHRIVRQLLKRYGGRELDTAGDGFFASFKEPASAIGCACAAVEAVRELGIEIRTGVHFGECEQIGKKLGGITVVVGARLMGLGGAGDVLVSATAADLTRGAGFGTVDRGSHALKGVEGEWRVLAVGSVDGTPMPAPADPEVAAARRAEIVPEEDSGRSRRRFAIVGVAAAVVVVLAGLALLRPEGSEASTIPGPNTVARLAPDGADFGQVIGVGENAFPDALTFSDGELWVANVANRTVVRVDPTSGNIQPVGAPSAPTGIAAADGRVWVTYGFNSDPVRRVDVVDPDGPVLAPAGIDAPDGSYPIAAGDDVLWIADPLGSTVMRFDPVTRSSATVTLPEGSGPAALAVAGRSLWVASGRESSVFRIDIGDADATPKRFDIGGGVPSGIAVTPDGTVWITERDADAVIALHPTGTTAVDVSVGDRCDGPAAIVASDVAVWVSCSLSSTIVRLDPADGSVGMALEVGGEPGPLAIDDAGGLWVGVRAG